MENIFKNAYFGKAYKTKDGRKAIYTIMSCDSHWLAIQDSSFTWEYNDDGELVTDINNAMNIVSEWKESINDEELEMLAFNNYCKDCHYCESANAKTLEEKYEACQKSECYRKTYVWKLINGYKAGYRKAKMG